MDVNSEEAAEWSRLMKLTSEQEHEIKQLRSRWRPIMEDKLDLILNNQQKIMQALDRIMETLGTHNPPTQPTFTRLREDMTNWNRSDMDQWLGDKS